MGVTDLLLLSCLGFAITAHAQDCARPAGGPNMHLMDEYILKETFSDGVQAVFDCDIGFMSAGGSSSIFCTAGSWSAVRLKCERKSCGSPGEVLNGKIHFPKENLFGDHIEITCHEGYRLVGKSTIVCGAQGWMDRWPRCEVATCAEAPQVKDATFIPYKDSYDFGDVVQYSCQNGLTLSGLASISCSEDGTFKPAPPTCTSINCELPLVEHGYADVQPPYRPNDNVTFECPPFYYMDGNATLTCEAEGKWSSPPPKCTLSDGAVAGVAIGGVGLTGAVAGAGGAAIYNKKKDHGRQKRLVEEIAAEAEEEVALLDGVGLKQSPPGNGQASGEGHRGQVPRKRVNPFGQK